MKLGKALLAVSGCLLPFSVLAQQPPQTAPAPGEPANPRDMTRITLHLKAASPDQIFQAIGQAGSIHFVPPASWGKNKDILANVDMDNRPFWLAALQLASPYGYSFDTATFTPADKRIKIQLTSGLSERKILQLPPLHMLARISRTQSKSIDLEVFADPMMQDWVFAAPIEVEELTDENGESILGKRSDDERLPPPSGMVTHHQIPVTRAVSKLSKFKGTIVLLTAPKVEVWEIAVPLAGPVQKKIDRTTYTVNSITRSQNRIEVKLHVKGPSDGGFKEGAAQLLVGPQSLIATDPTGTPWHISKAEGSYKSKVITAVGEYDYTLTFIPERGSGAVELNRLSWRLPLEMQNLELPFQFVDLPLR